MKTLSAHLPAGQMLVISKDLFAEFVDELVEAKVHFGLHFVVQELLPEDGQGVVGRVVVKVQWKQDTSKDDHVKS